MYYLILILKDRRYLKTVSNKKIERLFSYMLHVKLE